MLRGARFAARQVLPLLERELLQATSAGIEALERGVRTADPAVKRAERWRGP